MKNLIFIPKITISSIEKIEAHPIRETSSGVCEITTPNHAQFWSVYIKGNKESQCIADLPDEKSAIDMKCLIENIITLIKT